MFTTYSYYTVICYHECIILGYLHIMGIHKYNTKSEYPQHICRYVTFEPKSLQVGVTILRYCLFCLIVNGKKMNQVLNLISVLQDSKMQMLILL